MRTSNSATWVAALGIMLAAVTAASPAAAATGTGSTDRGTTCVGDRVTTDDLATGCTATRKTLVLDDGRTFVVPAAGVTVTAAPVVRTGATDPGDVVVANTGAAGVAVQVDDTWSGSPVAVDRERSALVRRTLGATVRGPLTSTGATTAASCGSSSYRLAGHHWNTGIRWKYNSSGQKASGLNVLQKAASAWNGSTTACGRTVTSSATNTYLGTTTQAPAVTSAGGCGTPNRTSVSGWGSLPSGVLGTTCVWSQSGGVAFETDQRYATGHAWSSTTVCSGSRFDLQGVATHEWGHSYGLGHAGDKSGLVMKPASTTCDTGQRTLGLGDLIGIGVLY